MSLTSVHFKGDRTIPGTLITKEPTSLTYSTGDEPVRMNKDVIAIMARVFADLRVFYPDQPISVRFDEFQCEEDSQSTPPEYPPESCSLLLAQVNSCFYYSHRELTYRSGETEAPITWRIQTQNPYYPKMIQQQGMIFHYYNNMRDLLEYPPNKITPERFVKYVKRVIKDKAMIHVWNEKRLKRDGFGGIIAVGKGSKAEPCLVQLTYRGKNASDKPYVLVGKGVTYDSGGYSLKPEQHLTEMKRDKTGACIALGVFQTVLKQEPADVHLVVLLPLVENMISDRAYKPDDVVRMYDGQTLEVENTDAEGRIVLGDAIAYAAKRLSPACILDVATLTGGTFLNNDYGAVFSNRPDLLPMVQTIAEFHGEGYWPMPLHERSQQAVAKRSHIANVSNGHDRKQGITIMGAAFISRFVPDEVPWIHFDLVHSLTEYEAHRGFQTGNMNGYFTIMDIIMNQRLK